MFRLSKELLTDCPCCGKKVLSGFWFKCYNCNSEFFKTSKEIVRIENGNCSKIGRKGKG